MGKFLKGHKGHWLGKKRPHSEETKRKISTGLQGHTHSQLTKDKIGSTSRGRVAWNKGRPWTADERAKISQTCLEKGIEPPVKYVGRGENAANWKGGKPPCVDCGKTLSDRAVKRCRRCANKGPLAYNWKGGVRTLHQIIRNSPEYKEWRKSVFRRDNYTCQECGTRPARGVKATLHADHIKRFADYPDLRFEVSNGRTLCEPCHKATSTWGGKKQPKEEEQVAA